MTAKLKEANNALTKTSLPNDLQSKHLPIVGANSRMRELILDYIELGVIDVTKTREIWDVSEKEVKNEIVDSFFLYLTQQCKAILKEKPAFSAFQALEQCMDYRSKLISITKFCLRLANKGQAQLQGYLFQRELIEIEEELEAMLAAYCKAWDAERIYGSPSRSIYHHVLSFMVLAVISLFTVMVLA